MTNKGPAKVRERVPGGAASASDSRVRRTAQALTHALVDLVQRQRYDAIRIQDLLDAAGVGRSTFYAHYRGKDDLLLRSFEALMLHLDGCLDEDGGSVRVAPVRELFAHVGDMLGFHRQLGRTGMLDRLYHAGTDVLAVTIAARLPARAEASVPPAVPSEVAARAHAGALFALLRWWVDHDRPHPPARMDALFHDLVLRP